MSSVEAQNLHDWYQEGYPTGLGDWICDADLLTCVLDPTAVFAPSPGDSGGIIGHPTHLPVFLGPNQTPEGWHPYAGADQQFPQTHMDALHGVQYPGPIATTATTADTMVVQDPSPWVAASCLPNMLYSAGPEAPPPPPPPEVTHACCHVAQQPLAPSLPGPPFLGPPPPIAHQHQHQESPLSEPIGCLQQHSFLCASKRATSAEHPDWQLLKHERKRAGRRAVEMRHRRKEREDHEKIETTSKRLQGLHANLVAEERALKEEKLSLMGQLLSHAHCNDSAIAEYLSYAPKQM